MVFSSLEFLLLFLPVTTALYYVIPKRFRMARNILLAVLSLLFYAWGEPYFVLVMMGSIVVNYLLALFISSEKIKCKKLLIILTVFVNVGLLFVFKYLNFAADTVNSIAGGELLHIKKIALPIGISFFTFQAMSYCIDVYRGKGMAQKNPLNVALYISFFPQLIAGPIVRYETIAEQINGRKETFYDFCTGAKRFCIGFIKKVLIANNVALIADRAFGMSELPVSLAWLGAICYSLQILFDFSGYSDMAIGLGSMFGFHFNENFDYPYTSKSITEFWRRWHISLGTWFRDYVYIPLGGSKVKVSRHIFNLFIVWLLTGLWHGADWSFVVWGLTYFVLLVLEKYLIHPERFKNVFAATLYRIFTLLCVMLGWVVFRAENIASGLTYIGSMFGISASGAGFDVTLSYVAQNSVWLVFAVIACMPVFRTIRKRLESKNFLLIAYDTAELVCTAVLFITAFSFVVIGANNPFIYFNF